MKAMTQMSAGSSGVGDTTSSKSAKAAEAAKTASGATVTDIATKRRVPNRRFDAEKVARLKLQIDEGNYRIDEFSVADRFIEHERNG